LDFLINIKSLAYPKFLLNIWPFTGPFCKGLFLLFLFLYLGSLAPSSAEPVLSISMPRKISKRAFLEEKQVPPFPSDLIIQDSLLIQSDFRFIRLVFAQIDYFKRLYLIQSLLLQKRLSPSSPSSPSGPTSSSPLLSSFPAPSSLGSNLLDLRYSGESSCATRNLQPSVILGGACLCGDSNNLEQPTIQTSGAATPLPPAASLSTSSSISSSSTLTYTVPSSSSPVSFCCFYVGPLLCSLISLGHLPNHCFLRPVRLR
jgi:hypothetical protein